MCKGTAKQEKGNIFPQTECTINYEDHSYVKYKMASNKISKNEFSEDDIKEKIYQQAYFEHMYNNFPKLSYDDICLNLLEKYPNICIKYTNNNFKYYKANQKILKKLQCDNKNLILNIKFRNECLEKNYYKFINSDNEQIDIIIYTTKDNLANLSEEY